MLAADMCTEQADAAEYAERAKVTFERENFPSPSFGSILKLVLPCGQY